MKPKLATISGWLLLANVALPVGAEALGKVGPVVYYSLWAVFLLAWLASLPVAVAAFVVERRASTWRIVFPVFLLLEWLLLLLFLVFLKLTAPGMIL